MGFLARNEKIAAFLVKFGSKFFPQNFPPKLVSKRNRGRWFQIWSPILNISFRFGASGHLRVGQGTPDDPKIGAVVAVGRFDLGHFWPQIWTQRPQKPLGAKGEVNPSRNNENGFFGQKREKSQWSPVWRFCERTTYDKPLKWPLIFKENEIRLNIT